MNSTINIYEYKKDVLSFEEIVSYIKKLNIDDLKTTNDVYNYIDKLNELLLNINYYDKYFNIKKSINNADVEKKYITNITNLYNYYDKLYSELIYFITNNFNIKQFTDNKYITYINKIYNLSKHIPKDSNKYSEHNFRCEEIYNYINEHNIDDDNKLDLVLEYVSLKEKMAKLKGYNSFLEQRLEELGLQQELFDFIINYKLHKKNINLELSDIYTIDYSIEYLKNVCSNYLDVNTINLLINNIDYEKRKNKTSHHFALSCYKKTPTIFINYDSDISGIDKLFHEISHAYHYVKASNNDFISYSPNQFISEMFAMTNEIILLNNINNNESKYILINNYNNFLIDAIESLKLERFIHDNYSTISHSMIKQFDSNYKNHLNYIFNDFYDINYALGIIIAKFLANKIIDHSIDYSKLDYLLKIDGNYTANEMLKNINIDINNVKIIEQIMNEIKREILDYTSNLSRVKL